MDPKLEKSEAPKASSKPSSNRNASDVSWPVAGAQAWPLPTSGNKKLSMGAPEIRGTSFGVLMIRESFVVCLVRIWISNFMSCVCVLDTGAQEAKLISTT